MDLDMVGSQTDSDEIDTPCPWNGGKATNSISLGGVDRVDRIA